MSPVISTDTDQEGTRKMVNKNVFFFWLLPLLWSFLKSVMFGIKHVFGVKVLT